MDALVEETVTEKGRQAIRVNGFVYRLDRKYEDYHTWRCSTTSCRARCKTGHGMRLLSKSGEHNHAEAPKKEVLCEIRRAVKRKAEESLGEKPSKIICTAIKGHEDELSWSEVGNLKKCVKRQRLRQRPKLPRTMMETLELLQSAIDDNAEYIKSKSGERMIRRIDRHNGIVMFCSQENLRQLCENNYQMFADGTFKFCPKFFHQLFTLHIFKDGGFYLPTVFFLLPDKKTSTYIAMLTMLKNETATIQLTLNPSTVLLDYELALHQAFQSVFPNIIIKGCHFHLAQNWWRKIQSLGLAQTYKSKESESGRWLKMCFGLPAIDADIVSDCFVLQLMEIAPEDIIPFADYIVSHYMEPTSTFPSHLWAGLTTSDLKSTNNGAESFHRYFGDLFSSPHPNIFLFMENLSHLQTVTEIKSRSVNKRERPSTKARDSHQQLRDRSISAIDFLSEVCTSMLPPTI